MCWKVKGQITKSDFDKAENLVNECRRTGLLPLDICADDQKRSAEHLEEIEGTVLEEAELAVKAINAWHESYKPVSFWDYQDCYIQMVVEKVDLKSLFSDICKEFHIPLINGGGWTDINSRAQMAMRFKEWELKGKKPILLYGGDFDPPGLVISKFVPDNFEQLAGATGWHPDNLIFDRFCLEYEFIRDNRLTWIDNLKTGKKKEPNDLNDPRHPDHYKPYVQDYIAKYGVWDPALGRKVGRKCEANALVIEPEAGRKLCLESILKYLSLEGIKEFKRETEKKQAELKLEIRRRLAENENC